MGYLADIQSPEDVKKLAAEQLSELCKEIRQFLIDHVSKTGGHLSSNLGTVELTVALHRAFSSPQDVIIFDVGHQAYTHKLLTGRAQAFDTLRQSDGLSGFPSPEESEHDPFFEGHGNVALSQAIGIARAKKLRGESGRVIAVVGDGSFTGGMVYEGMNNVIGLDNLILILNDNKMSISKNVGAISRYFTYLRTAKGYNILKDRVQTGLKKIPLIGVPIAAVIVHAKGNLRRLLTKSTVFEKFGFVYHGPLDGNDLDELIRAFSNVKQSDKPLFYHLVTVKGKGFAPAEDNPGAFHGVPSFDIGKTDRLDPDISPSDSLSDVFGRTLCKLALADKTVCGITAAMKYGTGLHYLRKAVPDRAFDVGMAEQHAVTFAAGLSKGGMKPVVAIYSTFLQRSYDQIFHDVVLNNANVLFAVDRAGLVPGDGRTHQGLFDVSILCQYPELTVINPCNTAETEYWLTKCVTEFSGPRAIRYAKGTPAPALQQLGCSGKPYDIIGSGNGKIGLVCYGSITEEALSVRERMGDTVDIIKCTVIHPLPDNLLTILSGYQSICIVEECIRAGSIGQQIMAALLQNAYTGKVLHLPCDAIQQHATVKQLRTRQGIDADSIIQKLKGFLP